MPYKSCTCHRSWHHRGWHEHLGCTSHAWFASQTFLHLCVCSYVYKHLPIQAHVEARGQPQISPLITPPSCISRQVLLLNLELPFELGWLLRKPQEASCLPPSTRATGMNHYACTRVPAQVLMLPQALQLPLLAFCLASPLPWAAQGARTAA